MSSKVCCQRSSRNSILMYTTGKPPHQSLLGPPRLFPQEISISGECGQQALPLKSTKSLLDASTQSMECRPCLKYPLYSVSLALKTWSTPLAMTAMCCGCTNVTLVGTSCFLDTPSITQEPQATNPESLTSLKLCSLTHWRWPLLA